MPCFRFRAATTFAFLLLTAAATNAVAVRAQTYYVRVSAQKHDVRDAIVSIDLPKSKGKKSSLDRTDAVQTLLAQKEKSPDGGDRLTFLLPELKQGESQIIALTTKAAHPESGVTVRQDGGNVNIAVGGKLFTRYDTTTGPNKPYFYPLFGPTGVQIVRHYPVEKVGTETTDHPHHRGLWFTYSKLNNVDFWTETAGKTGKTVHTAYEGLTGGSVFGFLAASADWITPTGKKIAEDKRAFRFFPLPNGEMLMDFDVTVRAFNGDLTWGDEKDGVIGLRVADSMRVDAKEGGKIVTSAGDTDAKAWGKTADWCDYSGPLDGQTVGIAILDAPDNLRHPTPWHVRTYGLFAANPFGLHFFDPAKKNDLHAGDYITENGKPLRFHYRLLFHKGDAASADVAAVYQSWTQPPLAEYLGEKGEVK